MENQLRHWQKPNSWTVLRMILSLPIAFILWLTNQTYTPFAPIFSLPLAFALVWLIGTGLLSDYLDGYLARKYQSQSKLGAFLDPLADKMFYLLIFWFMIPIFSKTLFFLTLAVESLLMLQRVVKLIFDNGEIRANIFGKTKAVFQYSAIFSFALGLLFSQLFDLYLPLEYRWQYNDLIIKTIEFILFTLPPVLAWIGFAGSLLSLFGQLENFAVERRMQRCLNCRSKNIKKRYIYYNTYDTLTQIGGCPSETEYECLDCKYVRRERTDFKKLNEK